MLLVSVYMGLLAVVSLAPKSRLDRIPYLFPGEDKLAHFVAYGIYGLILLRALRHRGGNHRWRSVITVTAICTGYGVLLELLQAAFPQTGRAFSFTDMLANAAGALVFTVLAARGLRPVVKDGDYS